MVVESLTLVDKASRGHLAEVRACLLSQQHPQGVVTAALLAASSRGHLQVCRALLRAGANPNQAEPHPAASDAHSPPAATSTAGSPSGMTHRAAPPLTRRKVRAEGRCEGLRSFRGSSLHKALESGSAECVLLLLDHGADLNLPDGRGLTAFCLAAMRPSSVGVLEAMLGSEGCRVDMKDPQQGRTALHCAASTGNLRAMEILCAAGSATHTRDLHGNTPLILAAKALRLHHNSTSGCDPIQAIGFLIDKGVSVGMVNRRGVSALLHAVEARATPAIELLVSGGACVTTDLLRYACLVLKDTKVVNCLLQGQTEDSSLAAILVNLIGNRPSKWTFANNIEERKAHELARLMIANIRNVGIVNSMLEDDFSRSVLLDGFGDADADDRLKAEKVLVDFGIVGYALMNGKFSIAHMLNQAGFRLQNHSGILALPWLQEALTTQKLLLHKFSSPCSLKSLTRSCVISNMRKLKVAERGHHFPHICGEVKDYLGMTDLKSTSPYDGIIRGDMEILLNERYPGREKSRALHESLFWIY